MSCNEQHSNGGHLPLTCHSGCKAKADKLASTDLYNITQLIILVNIGCHCFLSCCSLCHFWPQYAAVSAEDSDKAVGHYLLTDRVSDKLMKWSVRQVESQIFPSRVFGVQTWLEGKIHQVSTSMTPNKFKSCSESAGCENKQIIC